MVCLTCSHTAPGLADGHFLTPWYPHVLRQPCDCLPLSFGPWRVQIKRIHIFISSIFLSRNSYVLMSQEIFVPSFSPAGWAHRDTGQIGALLSATRHRQHCLQKWKTRGKCWLQNMQEAIMKVIQKKTSWTRKNGQYAHEPQTGFQDQCHMERTVVVESSLSL